MVWVLSIQTPFYLSLSALNWKLDVYHLLSNIVSLLSCIVFIHSAVFKLVMEDLNHFCLMRDIYTLL